MVVNEHLPGPDRAGLVLRQTQPVRPITGLVAETQRLHDGFLAARERASRSAGLTAAKWDLLRAIADQALSVAQIARRLGLTRQSVQRTADLLYEDGLVVYLPNPDHRRAQLASLTETGETTLRAAGQAQAQWRDRVEENVDPEDVAAAIRLMRRVRAELDRLDEELAPDPADGSG